MAEILHTSPDKTISILFALIMQENGFLYKADKIIFFV